MEETIGGANKRNMRGKLFVNRNGQSNLHRNHLHLGQLHQSHKQSNHENIILKEKIYIFRIITVKKTIWTNQKMMKYHT